MVCQPRQMANQWRARFCLVPRPTSAWLSPSPGDVVFTGWDDAVWQAPDLPTFLREYPQRGLRWS